MHAVELVAPAVENEPLGHSVHEDAPLAEYDPAVHVVHVNAPAGENVPAAHVDTTPLMQEEPAGHNLALPPSPVSDVLPY